ncbi:MAG: HD domain-containing protein [Caldibacillus debilis]|jgi:HD-GYP domain-containing protein (c-di-GMP phosphodiesterase class II)|uniref:Response regulator containing a CheY-like receiver domain and an HD-GYP domain n=2 Tax=Caldibacillus debilis TaxID=301148 RepID=A0A420VHF3_9BACI|nr:HD domain-containing phosphohydrolase [Caldibacillus debilis]MBO2482694.1 HD domain-containing protein [Bacillaceae bacterium]MBY6272445.1 HD domain-containing protein [Bacillaceae bacterium]REJ17237.1 MAG: HD domain-containing protein [Caldibacillus debilis]REJ28346.1 MAG: HD domain-containing protein [Caldibacillus debilis]REJ30168.1 MAG: HD domain-containing protein [Caldibacillus debilis]
MQFNQYGLVLHKNGEALENISYKGIQFQLLASYDGTEVIKHTLDQGTKWTIISSSDWNGLEFLYVLKGSLLVTVDEKKLEIHAGDNLSLAPVKKTCIFEAQKPTEFIYVSSRPVFKNYTDLVEQLKQLGIIVEEKDGYTADHCVRIKEFSLSIGKMLNLSQKELYVLHLGSFLHDIGKVKIPDSILQKPGKLTKEEWDIIKMHPIYGRDILLDSKLPMLMQAATIVEQHHERYDGKGYPFGLKGEEISIGAAIVAVADSLDAMTTDRVYRKARTWEEAVQEIKRGSGTLYNPRVVDAFLAIESNLKKMGGFV